MWTWLCKNNYSVTVQYMTIAYHMAGNFTWEMYCGINNNRILLWCLPQRNKNIPEHPGENSWTSKCSVDNHHTRSSLHCYLLFPQVRSRCRCDLRASLNNLGELGANLLSCSGVHCVWGLVWLSEYLPARKALSSDSYNKLHPTMADHHDINNWGEHATGWHLIPFV